jgi:hypothetical protein
LIWLPSCALRRGLKLSRGVIYPDPGNAAVCARAAGAASDPVRRALLVYLGEFRLELARHRGFTQLDRLVGGTNSGRVCSFTGRKSEMTTC